MKKGIEKLSDTRQQKRVRKTRKKLKDAAMDVFSEKSIDAATVADIAEKADLGKGTLYHHFDDKDEMVIVLVEDAVEHLIKYIRSYDSAPETLEDMLEHLLNVHYKFSLEANEEFLLLFQGKLQVKLQSEYLDELQEPYMHYLKEIESQVSKYLPPNIDSLEVRRLACAVAGFIFGFLSFAMIGMTESQIEDSIKPLGQVFVRSLCVFPGK